MGHKDWKNEDIETLYLIENLTSYYPIQCPLESLRNSRSDVKRVTPKLGCLILYMSFMSWKLWKTKNQKIRIHRDLSTTGKDTLSKMKRVFKIYGMFKVSSS